MSAPVRFYRVERIDGLFGRLHSQDRIVWSTRGYTYKDVHAALKLLRIARGQRYNVRIEIATS